MKRGLKFTPTPNKDKVQLGADIDDFCRRLRINYIFYKDDEEKDEELINEPLVRNKSNWVPKSTKDKYLEETITTLKTHSLECDNNVKHNLTRGEENAIKSIRMDKSIVIKEADKGNAVVVLDRDFYRDKILNMLSDAEYYALTDKKSDQKTRKIISKLLKKHKKELFDEEIDYIENFQFTDSNFYGLPKIHKSKEITTAIETQNSEFIECLKPDDLKFRPIVGGPNSITQRLSEFVDIILKPLCSEVSSFIKDDLEFLDHLPQTVCQNSELVTFDVVSLYSNIPHELGISAIKFWIEKKRHLIESRFTDEFILSAIKIILENNTFYFDGSYYRQQKGTAMGTKMAPTYATLVLGHLEHKLYENLKCEYGEELSNYIQHNWKRFLDDCFIIWNSNTCISLEEFYCKLNNMNENIQFTMERSRDKLPFLDVMILIGDDGRIKTDIYSKPTDTHMYLNFKSCHPKHVKLNIPFNLASRIITITNTGNAQNQRLEELKRHLRKQDYPEEIINFGIQKALEKGPIKTDQRNTNKTVDEIIPFVTTFNPRDFNVFKFMKQIENNLHESEKMNKVLSKKKIINSKRQPKNLKRILTNSRFDFTEVGPSVQRCSDKRCRTCPSLIEGNSITFINGKHFTVRQSISCKTRNVIYSLICKKCKQFYVGETKTELKTRMTVHRQQTNHEDLTIIRANEHFAHCSGGQFHIFPLYKVYGNDFFRKEKEHLFIDILEPSLNDK